MEEQTGENQGDPVCSPSTPKQVSDAVRDQPASSLPARYPQTRRRAQQRSPALQLLAQTRGASQTVHRTMS